ncbi:MAG: hypothetical protein FJW20_10805 [Acidimicrobiia bacterium]|nr:hypothetical protein [Acidimicrobiia bacterium]
MTKVELELRLARFLDEALLDKMATAHSLYGMYRVQLAPDLKSVRVEYDASRLTCAQVEAALLRAGIPAARP